MRGGCHLKAPRERLGTCESRLGSRDSQQVQIPANLKYQSGVPEKDPLRASGYIWSTSLVGWLLGGPVSNQPEMRRGCPLKCRLGSRDSQEVHIPANLNYQSGAPEKDLPSHARLDTSGPRPRWGGSLEVQFLTNQRSEVGAL